MAVWSQDVEKYFIFLRFFLEKRPLTENFQNSHLKGFIASPIDVLCSNVVKFGRREIDKVVSYLPDKEKQNFTWLSTSRYCTAHAQILPDPAPENVLRVLQISSKSVHCN